MAVWVRYQGCSRPVCCAPCGPTLTHVDRIWSEVNGATRLKLDAILGLATLRGPAQALGKQISARRCARRDGYCGVYYVPACDRRATSNGEVVAPT